MENLTLLVVGPDGRIVQTSEDAPRAWKDKLIANAVGLPGPVVQAANRLVAHARRSPTWIHREVVDTYELLVVEAVPLRRHSTDVHDLLTRTTELLLEQAKAIEVSLQVRTDEAMPTHLVVDGEKIAWGIAMLVGRALRHLTRKHHEKGHVRVRARYAAESHEIEIIVHDNGPGIPNERLLGILTPGVKTPRQASALALVMLQDVVTAHGGRLHIESSTDAETHGTTVTLALPASCADG